MGLFKKKEKKTEFECNLCDAEMHTTTILMCPNCSATGEDDMCPNCNSKMDEVELLMCPNCGNTIDEVSLKKKLEIKKKFDKLT